MSRLTLRLLGPPEVERSDGVPLPPTRTRKGLWLLALLALRGGKPVGRLWLTEQLWPDVPAEAGRANLRRALTDLRRVLGPDSALLTAPTLATLALDTQQVECDLLHFDSQPQANIALYRGPLLDGCREEWVFPERQHREETYLQARLALARTSPAPLAQEHLEAVLRIDPTREAAVRALMELHAAARALSEALRVYRQFREVLRPLRLLPDPQTTALFDTLRRQLPQPPPEHKQTRRAQPPLPTPLTPLVGRQHELEQVRMWLREGVRLITLLGPGGVGKTRLALAVATALAAHETVWGVVDCGPVAQAAELPQALTRALDLPLPPGHSHEQALSKALDGGVLFLDNLEQVQGEPGRVLAGLLQGCGSLQVVVTSRVRMELAGEVVLRLSGLPPDDAQTLFLQRATAAGAHLSHDDHPSITQLCTRLDGLPLALELAAPWCELLPPERLLTLLAQPFALLQGKGGQKGLEATLAWSWARLRPEQQQHLAALAVLRGAWSLPAGQAALDQSDELDALETLSNLADTSWLVIEPVKPRRYRLLESIRAYIGLQDTAALQRAAQHRLLLWWEDQLGGDISLDTGHWLRVIDEHIESLRSALDYAAEEPALAERGLALLDAASVYFLFRGLSQECQDRALALLQNIPTRSARHGRWLYLLGGCALRLRDYPRAQAVLEEALTVDADPQGRAYLLGLLGVSLRLQGKYEAAQHCHEESHALHLSLGRSEPASVEKMRLGVALRERGELDAARSWLAAAATTADTIARAGSLAEWARVERQAGDSERAKHLFAEAILLQGQLGNYLDVEVLEDELALL